MNTRLLFVYVIATSETADMTLVYTQSTGPAVHTHATQFQCGGNSSAPNNRPTGSPSLATTLVFPLPS